MVSQKLIVKNESGLHARPAAILAKAVEQCKSTVTIVAGDQTVKPQSALNLMAAAIRCGTEIEIQCDGETEEEDLKTLVDLIEDGLGESGL